jgi:hypothetical protein
MEMLLPASSRLCPQVYQRTVPRPKYISQVQIVHDVQKMEMLGDAMRYADRYRSMNDGTRPSVSPQFGTKAVMDQNTEAFNLKVGEQTQSKLLVQHRTAQDSKSVSPCRKLIKITVKPEKVTYFRDGKEVQMIDEPQQQQTSNHNTVGQGDKFWYQGIKIRAKPSLSPNRTSYVIPQQIQPQATRQAVQVVEPFPVVPAPSFSFFDCPRDLVPIPSKANRLISPSIGNSDIFKPGQKERGKPSSISPKKSNRADKSVFESKYLKRSASRKLKKSNFISPCQDWIPAAAQSLPEEQSLLQDPLTQRIRRARDAHPN